LREAAFRIFLALLYGVMRRIVNAGGCVSLHMLAAYVNGNPT